MRIDIYDPAMCCSTGVCGPEVDSQLVQFAADARWLGAQGVVVQRHNLRQAAGTFMSDALGVVRLRDLVTGATMREHCHV